MTKEEIIDGLEIYTVGRLKKDRVYITVEELQKFIDEIKALEQEPCEDAVSRKAVLDEVNKKFNEINIILENLPSVRPQEQTGHCKDCKYFEYDSWLYVNETPLIAAHEVCNRWAGGWKTKEDGYCFMFEPKTEGEDKK